MFHTLPSRATDLSTDLIAYWNFENGSTLGTPFYGDLNLTDVNGPSYTATGGYNSSKGLSLNGSSYLRATSYPSSLNGNGAYTIAAWFKTTTGNNGGILGYGGTGTCKGNNLRLSGSTRLHSYWYSCDLSSSLVSNFVNSWHHVAVTYNGTTRSFYYDGAFLNSRTGQTRATTGTEFLLGKTINDVAFSGVLDEVAIYTRALSLAEVQQLKDGGLNSTPPTISSAPTISGVTTIGETLTTTTGTWTNTPTSFSYQWSRADSSGGAYTNISGATSSTYNLVTADVGKYLKSTVTAINADGSALSTSDATGQISKANQAPITITSTSASFGSDLSLTSTGGSTGGTFTYTVISGSCTIEGSTLTPTAAGSCVIRSSLAENDNYLAAQSADTTINISTTSVSATITLEPGALTYRQAKSVSASSSVAGKVTFKVNGKVIPRCKKKVVAASATVICSYRPSTRGYVVITATLNPTDPSYIGTTTTTSRYFVGNRSGARGG